MASVVQVFCCAGLSTPKEVHPDLHENQVGRTLGYAAIIFSCSLRIQPMGEHGRQAPSKSNRNS